MASEVDHHFFFDSSFFAEVKSNGGSIYEVAEQLAYITSKATHNKRRQNKISHASFAKLVAEHGFKEESARIFLNRVDPVVPEIECEADEVTRTIKYAVYVTTTWPNRTIIFTSSSNAATYASSAHLQGVNNVVVLSGPAALAMIQQWHKRCREERESSCG